MAKKSKKITKAQMRQVERLLGIPEHLSDGEPDSPRRSKQAPVVVREYVPSEKEQIEAIGLLLRDAINTIPVEKRERCPDAPESAERRSSELRARTSIPQS